MHSVPAEAAPPEDGGSPQVRIHIQVRTHITHTQLPPAGKLRHPVCPVAATVSMLPRVCVDKILYYITKLIQYII